MSFSASVSQIIFADTDGVVRRRLRRRAPSWSGPTARPWWRRGARRPFRSCRRRPRAARARRDGDGDEQTVAHGASVPIRSPAAVGTAVGPGRAAGPAIACAACVGWRFSRSRRPSRPPAIARRSTSRPACGAHLPDRRCRSRSAQPSTIDVGVTVEGATVPDVEITIPAGLRLDRVDPKAGWTITAHRARAVRYRGGPIAAFTCEYFSLGVTAPAQGVVRHPGRPTHRRGRGRRALDPRPGQRDRAGVLDQIVYAGVKPPSIRRALGGPSTTTIAGYRARRRSASSWSASSASARGATAGATTTRTTTTTTKTRDDDDRDAELRARLERFKKRTPGPPTGVSGRGLGQVRREPRERARGRRSS